MKYIYLLLFFITLNVYSYEDPIKIPKYENSQSGTLYLPTPFAKPFIINKKDIDFLEDKKIHHIDLVYTEYHESEDFDQIALNNDRIERLKKLLPQVVSDNPDWTVYEQTEAKTRKVANEYFHGFVIHYGDPVDFKSQTEFFSDWQKSFSELEINNQEKTILEYYSGSIIEIQPNSVAFKDGSIVQGGYTFYYREYRNQAEIALSGIPMNFYGHGEDEIFNSAGMYELRAEKDGEELVLLKPIIVNFQTTNVLEDVRFFTLSDSTGHWAETIPNLDYGFAQWDEDDKNAAKDFDFNKGKQLYTQNYRPQNNIDQGAYQGYTKIKEEIVLDKDQVFVGLNSNTWRKYRFVEGVDSIKNIVSEVNNTTQTMLVSRLEVKGFIELLMGQDIESLKKETDDEKRTVYSNGSNKSKNGLTKLDEDFRVPSAYGLIQGLRSPDFGVYNCDQTKRIDAPLALSPIYYDISTKKKIDDLYVACVIDLNINASLSYSPNRLICNKAGENKIILFNKDKEIFLFEKEGFQSINPEGGEVDLYMENITSKVSGPDDLQAILDI